MKKKKELLIYSKIHVIIGWRTRFVRHIINRVESLRTAIEMTKAKAPKKKPLDRKKFKIQRLMLLRFQGVTGNTQLVRQMKTKFKIAVSLQFVRTHASDEKYQSWMNGDWDKVERKDGSCSPSILPPEVR